MLDDLRRSASDEFEDQFESETFDFEAEIDRARSKRFLGMTAVERMFISIFLFLNVCILGLAALLLTGRIQL
jgi:hypothetical protein